MGIDDGGVTDVPAGTVRGRARLGLLQLRAGLERTEEMWQLR